MTRATQTRLLLWFHWTTILSISLPTAHTLPKRSGKFNKLLECLFKIHDFTSIWFFFREMRPIVELLIVFDSSMLKINIFFMVFAVINGIVFAVPETTLKMPFSLVWKNPNCTTLYWFCCYQIDYFIFELNFIFENLLCNSNLFYLFWSFYLCVSWSIRKRTGKFFSAEYLLKRNQIFGSALSISVRFKFLKLPTAIHFSCYETSEGS